jgi:hypothetical protein
MAEITEGEFRRMALVKKQKLQAGEGIYSWKLLLRLTQTSIALKMVKIFMY